MKLIHLSDLHLGKRVNEFSMLEDQAYILAQIVGLIDLEQPDGVLIAGDIYDHTVPPAEAVGLFDGFLTELAERRLQVFVISGNHDSPERIAFGARLMNQSGVHLSPVYSGQIRPVICRDEHGPVNVYLLPFLKPAQVRRFFPDEPTESYTEALDTAIRQLRINPAERNILLTHQFVTGGIRSESEEISVGGSDNVDAAIFQDFDYVALGHLHAPQNVGSEALRYCGSPLKYSFSEANQGKSVTVVELTKKNSLTVRTVPLQPKRDLRQIRGTYMELTAKKNYENTKTDDYLHITLTDEEDILDAVGKLRTIYPFLMKLDYDNQRTRNRQSMDSPAAVETKTPIELLAKFYELQNNQPLTAVQIEFATRLIDEIWEVAP